LEVLTDLFAPFLTDLVEAFRFLETVFFPGFDTEVLRDLEAFDFEDLTTEVLRDLVCDFLPCFAGVAFLLVLDFGFLRDLETVDLDLIDLALLPLFDFEATDLPALPFEDFRALDAGAFPFLGADILVDLDEEVLRDLVLAALRAAGGFVDLAAAPLRDLAAGRLPALATEALGALRVCDLGFAPEAFLTEDFLAAAGFGAAFRAAGLPTAFAADRCADFFGAAFAGADFLTTAFGAAALAGAALRAGAGAALGFAAGFGAGFARFSKSRETTS
jgi:hypothetical protein